MRVRLFGLGWHLPLMLLWVAESLAALSACRLAALLLNRPAAAADSPWVQALVFGACVTLVMVAMGLFSRRLRDRTAGIVLRITVSVLAGGVMAGLLLGLSPRYALTLRYFGISLAVAWALLVLVRSIARGLIDQDVFKQRIMVIGAGVNAARLLDFRRREDRRGFKVIGFVPIPGEAIKVSERRVLKESGTLASIAAANEIDEIVVAMDERRQQFPLKELLECRLAGFTVSEPITFLERETGKVHLNMLNPSWMIFGGGFRRNLLRQFSERAFDLVASLILLAAAAPFMILVALAIKLEDGHSAPVIYSQPRVGQAGRIFRVRKFRSMRTDAEKDGKARWATANDKRVTHVGSFIRKVRLDELPQLYNVFRGDMSFVGPRPERPEFVQQLGQTIPYYDERHSVKPGITGWAQLCYPYGASQEDAIEKLQYDLYYVKHHSLAFDLLILLQTAEVILFGKGAR
jgi:sugar transferase (PEP-CTERM system associated)